MFGKKKTVAQEVTVALGLKIADGEITSAETQTIEFGVQARFQVNLVTRRVSDSKALRSKQLRDFGICFQTWKVPLDKLQLVVQDGYIDLTAACALFRQDLINAGHLSADTCDETASEFITGNMGWDEVIKALREECPELPENVVIRTAQ